MRLFDEKNLHRFFEIGVILKGLHAIFETIAGIFLYFTSTEQITTWVVNVIEDELSEDPHDSLSNFLLHGVQSLSIGGKTFAAFYLLSHGVIKLVLVVGLLRRRLWAYPASIIVLALFIVYQLYRYSITHGLGLLALTVFDVIIIALVWREYRVLKRMHDMYQPAITNSSS